MSSLDHDYTALTTASGLVDVSDRTQIELTGDDRAAFLHNLCTNEIRKLPTGQGREAFFLDARGHILGMGTIYAGPESHVIETVAGQGSRLTAHLDRYLIREKAEIHDRSAEWGEVFLGGPNAEKLLQPLVNVAIGTELCSHTAAQLAGCRVWIRRVDFTRQGGFLVACRAHDVAAISAALAQAGAAICSREALEVARIEARTPWYGIDVTEKNLPQEVARDQRAISFTKGCYIGQETVARLDAMGHVNKLLVGMRFQGAEIPAVGSDLTIDSQAIGNITSSAWSPGSKSPVALGYVRREHAKPGTRITSPIGVGEVVE